MLRIKACGLSDVGLARSHNEDCFGIDPENRLYVVADGMGGHSHGEVASRIAVDSVQDFIRKAAPGSQRGSSQETGDAGGSAYTGQILVRAFRTAHERVLGAIREDGSLYGMGTTLVGVLLHNHQAAVAHVGDSRAYRLRKGNLELLTQDHTWVNEQVVAGFLTEEEARGHPLKNVITRALGGESEIQVDLKLVHLEAGDIYLLCSDGLTTMLNDADIRDRLSRSVSLEEVCRSLIYEANQRGGIDNITVLLLKVEEGDGAPPAA